MLDGLALFGVVYLLLGWGVTLIAMDWWNRDDSPFHQFLANRILDDGIVWSAPSPTPPIIHRSTEVLGWRAWDLVLDADGEPILESLNIRYHWDGPSAANATPPTVVWTMLAVRSDAPGFFARKTREGAAAYLDGHRAAHRAFGEVALSGLVIEGEDGYRAQRCTIRSLTIFGGIGDVVNVWDLAARLESRYACDVTIELPEPSAAEAYALSWDGADRGWIALNDYGASADDAAKMAMYQAAYQAAMQGMSQQSRGLLGA
jgi:hypothetical protein